MKVILTKTAVVLALIAAVNITTPTIVSAEGDASRRQHAHQHKTADESNTAHHEHAHQHGIAEAGNHDPDAPLILEVVVVDEPNTCEHHDSAEHAPHSTDGMLIAQRNKPAPSPAEPAESPVPSQSQPAGENAGKSEIPGVINLGWSCNYTGEKMELGPVQTFASTQGAKDVVSAIVKAAGIPPKFVVREGHSSEVQNAAAGISHDRKRVILYNRNFIENVRQRTGNDWAPISIMAHEIAHHLIGHTIEGGGSRPDIELEADKSSGNWLAKMGASLDDAQIAMKTLVSEQGSATHPPRSQRLQAIAEGWNEGCRESTKCQSAQRGEEVFPDIPTTPTPQPRPQPTPQPTPQPIPQPYPNPYPVPQIRNAVCCNPITGVPVCNGPSVDPIGAPCSCWGIPGGIICR